MNQSKKTGHGKKTVIAVFLLLLFLPGFLMVISKVLHKPFDIPLGGYTAGTERPSLSISAWLSGDLQKNLTETVEEQIKPRGLLVKTYNTINFVLFGKSERVIGKKYDIFEPEYINAELALNRADDFSQEDNIAAMKEFVQQLDILQDKLDTSGKSLLVYIAPSKANLHKENIPDKYIALSSGHERAVDLFREEMEKTDIPFLICSDLADQLEYPAFYSTGIHWSRTYEQKTSKELIKMIQERTGMPYSELVLYDVVESTEPFWRDNDVLDLANVFYKPNETYYEYLSYMDMNADSPVLRILLQGDSFALGLRKDILENDPDAEIYLVTNDYSVTDRNDEVFLLNYDWGNLNWQYYLDHCDIVVVEIAEPFVKHRTYGFVQRLLTELENYIPNDSQSKVD